MSKRSLQKWVSCPISLLYCDSDFNQFLHRANPLGRGGEVAEEFAVVVRANWSGQYRSIAPRDLRDTVTKYVPEFRKHVGHHHDSQEFLLFLLDGLHEDLNEVIFTCLFITLHFLVNLLFYFTLVLSLILLKRYHIKFCLGPCMKKSCKLSINSRNKTAHFLVEPVIYVAVCCIALW